MTDDCPPFDPDSIVMPALLRHARTTYGKSMRAALEAAGYDDIPRNGLYVIGGLALGPGNVPLGALIADLGVSKQVAGQLIDTLVLRGYLERTVDDADRRKLNVALTARGQAAADAQRSGREKIDTELLTRVSAEDVARARAVLWALIDMRPDEEEHHH